MTTTLEHSATPAIETQEPTRDGLKEVITDLPLVRIPNIISEEYCNRCDRKNDVRRRYDLPQRDPLFDDGERVTLICGYNADPEETEGWVIRAVHHTDHPTKGKDDVARPGQAQAEVTATLDRTGWTYTFPPLGPDDEPEENHIEERSVVRDVEIEWFSPVDEGQEREPIREPDEHGMIELKPTDPRPDWPDEENEWRKEVMQEHGDWNDDIPTVHLGDPSDTPTPDYPDGPGI